MKKLTEAAQCAKEIKQELKKMFPNVKFSVKSDNFSMGDAVNISWNFGPTRDQIETIVKDREGGYFDGMQDMYVPRHTTKASAKYIQCRREYNTPGEQSYTGKFTTDICKELCKYFNVDYLNNSTNLYQNVYMPAEVLAYRTLAVTTFESENVELKKLKRNDSNDGPDWLITYTNLKK